MKSHWIITIALVALLSCALQSVAEEQEKKIERSNLPPAVEKTVAAQAQAATIRGFAEEIENGQKLYEVKLMVDGHKKNILIDANGAIVEVEEQVAMESLPSAVRDGLQAKAGSGKVVKVESITKNNKLVAYEAKVMTNGKKSEVQVGPDGKPLDHEE
jgi:uncharacterized membrane protein YkoI